MSLKIFSIALDKESWENIPPVVWKSFQAFGNNMSNLKKWADRSEDKVKSSLEISEKLAARLDGLEATIQSLSGQLQAADEKMASMKADSSQQALACTDSLQRLDRCIGAVFSNLGKTFGVELDDLKEEDAECGIGDEEAASEGAGEEEDNQKVAKEEPENKGEESVDPAAERAEDESSPPASLPPGVERMNSVGRILENNLEALSEVFGRWAEQQLAEESRLDDVAGNIDEIRSAGERTRERLLTWREMLKESSHAIDSLGQSLSRTQAAVQELHSTRVQHHDVEAVVGRKAEELKELHRLTDDRVDGLTSHVEAHMADVNQLIVEARRQTDDKIEDHSNQTSQMVERHMNPLNAYLNTMHVKTDVMRVELDSVGERLPKLARSIGDVGQQLKQTEAVLAAKNVTIQQDAQTLSDSLAECLLRVEENYGELGTSIAGVSKDLGDQLHELRSRLLGTAQAVEAMKAEELSGLARELLTLEQKVAKWVHAHPLPAKISEARLYSLEARLAEEMDQRMMFETKVRSKGLITPRGNGMPQVQNMGMWQSQEMGLPQLSIQSADGSQASGDGSATGRSSSARREGPNVGRGPGPRRRFDASASPGLAQ